MARRVKRRPVESYSRFGWLVHRLHFRFTMAWLRIGLLRYPLWRRWYTAEYTVKRVQRDPANRIFELIFLGITLGCGISAYGTAAAVTRPTYTAMYNELVIIKVWLIVGMSAYFLLVAAVAKVMVCGRMFRHQPALPPRRSTRYRQS